MITEPKPNEMLIAAAIPTQQPDSMGRRTWYTAWLDSDGRVRGQVHFRTFESFFDNLPEGKTIRRVSLADMDPLFEAAKAQLLADLTRP